MTRILQAVACFGGFEQRVERLGEVAAGVEREDVEGEVGGGDGGEHGLILDAEARREGDAAGDVVGDRRRRASRLGAAASAASRAAASAGPADEGGWLAAPAGCGFNEERVMGPPD